MITARDHKWLSHALVTATGSDCTHRVGAVLVKGGSPIARKSNRMRHNPEYPPADVSCSIHAEQHTLRTHGDRASGSTVYVARLTVGGNVGLAKPCPACAQALHDHGVSRVVWTTNEGVPQAARVRDLVA